MLFLREINENQFVFPYTTENLKRDFPNISFTDNVDLNNLRENNIFPVRTIIDPDIDHLIHRTEFETPTKSETGEWTVRIKKVLLGAESVEVNVKNKRQRLLQETDWMAIRSYETETPLPAGVKEYRQKLRDITTQELYPFYVEWPTKDF